MKPMIRALGAVTLGCMLPLAAQTTTTETTTELSQNPDGSVTKTETTTTAFNPEAQTKVVKYFETYKTSPHGLPPTWGTRMRIKEVPAAWRTTRVAPGVVITEKERPYLVEAPSDLVSVLPAPSAGVRYYVAGSNVVAVDPGYRVVDSVRIPSINITAEVEDDDDD